MNPDQYRGTSTGRWTYTDQKPSVARGEDVDAAFERGAKAWRDHKGRGRPHPANPFSRPDDPNVAYSEWHAWNRGWNGALPNSVR